ncbi:ribosome small subunit-dependent GTPase A [Ruminococcus sp.]|uniref:ribosome small subunit-dependent GTPase A n=1 Tax=Ruminococcus sp. TaxID=41978 RepID=UPI0025F8AB75|nr:ribosome small subunit-dependent GTPase A [Ruminococcus sp.]MBQ8965350.1 ribosome small subunit-dependent GTPase A [Ruminococcus sp.]
MTGIITRAIGGLYTVDASVGIYECKARGIFRKKKISPMCGDKVEFTEEKDGCVIEEILPRRSELIRPPLANLDVLVFVSSTVEPRPNTLLLDKFIAIAEFKKIKPVVVFTKVDKRSGADLAEIYRSVGIDVFECDNVTGEGSAAVKKLLQGKLSAFTGNTGVGKSSLLNNMYPELGLATGEISKKLGRGRHTTRHVQLYKLEGGGYIADTPGFSSFDTNRYDIIFKDQLADCFAEFREYTDSCRFPDCSHTKEKGCAVIEAVNAGSIPRTRFDSYLQMYEEAKQLKEWEYKND